MEFNGQEVNSFSIENKPCVHQKELKNMKFLRTKTNNPANAAKPNVVHACFALLISQRNVLAVSVVGK